MNTRTVLAIMLVTALAGGALAERQASGGEEKGAALSELAGKIRAGRIDVGKQYGMAPDRRFHRIHADTVGLDCAGCHVEKFPAGTEIFSLPPAVDLSKDSPSPVDRRRCLGCHSGGVAKKVYGP